MNNKIYFTNELCTIGDKVWLFNGYNGSNQESQLFFSVRNIAGIGVAKKYPKWWIWLLAGCVIGLYGVSSDPYLFLTLGVILIIVAIILRSKRRLIVYTNNSNLQFEFKDISTLADANKYISAMQKCLIDYGSLPTETLDVETT
ncbi:MAG: hypothetical protein IJU35_04415 [Paludibacteraceae bacterium]|nr:hypothetical protein [Paludibacteraceae bacterium]